MEQITQNLDFYIDFRNAPLRFPSVMEFLKKKFGYESDAEIPWIFRKIPGAKEKCIMVEINAFNGITITFSKYKYTRDSVLLRMQQGRKVEGYFERTNYSSEQGFFFSPQLYDEFVEIQTETIHFEKDLSPLNTKIRALSLRCDGDDFLIPRELVTRRIREANSCFLSNIAMDYLIINKNFRRISFFNEFLRRFIRTVSLGREATFYYATIQRTGERKLAYIVFSDSLYCMSILYQYFTSHMSFENSIEAENREISSLPNFHQNSSYRDFSIDIDFSNYDLLVSNGGLIAVLNIQSFLDQIDEEERVENLIFDPLPVVNETYACCEVFLYKSSWRYFMEDEKIAEDCSICLTKFNNNDVVKKFACQKHIFHSKCIDVWINEHSTCPLCKYSLSSGLRNDEEGELLRKKRSNH